MKKKWYYPHQIYSMIMSGLIVGCTFLLPWVKVGEKWYGLLELIFRVIQKGNILAFFASEVPGMTVGELKGGSAGIGLMLIFTVIGYSVSAVSALLYIYYVLQLLKKGGEDSFIIWIWVIGMAITWGFVDYQKMIAFTFYDYIFPFPGQFVVAGLILLEFFGSRALFEMGENERTEKELARMQQVKNEMLEKNYHEILELTQKSRMAYHDFKNDINVLRQYAANNEIDKLKAYLNEIGTPVFALESYTWSGNQMIDLILNQKYREAKEAGVDFQVDAEWVGQVPLSDREVCSVFGNLLDNALEACELVRETGRWIKVAVKKRKQILQIRIENSIEKQPVKYGMGFLTRKSDRDMHGIGLKSVESIVERHQGDWQINYSSDKFEVCLTFFGAE